MPLYDLQCQGCLTIQRDVLQPARVEQPKCACGGSIERVWLASAPVHIFNTGFYEHLAYDPIYFDSRQKLKAYCREKDLIMDYVEGR